MSDAGGNFIPEKFRESDNNEHRASIIILIPPSKQCTCGSMHYSLKMNAQKVHRYQCWYTYSFIAEKFNSGQGAQSCNTIIQPPSMDHWWILSNDDNLLWEIIRKRQTKVDKNNDTLRSYRSILIRSTVMIQRAVDPWHNNKKGRPEP